MLAALETISVDVYQSLNIILYLPTGSTPILVLLRTLRIYNTFNVKFLSVFVSRSITGCLNYFCSILDMEQLSRHHYYYI